ncbi:SHD1 domain-containing protein [Pontiellaceae bacterium B12227]|nr:SHD1 domain-containing protein [Pontiellaceae bacterium B12227]
MMMKKWVCLVVSVLCLCRVQAEMRIWSDKKGNTIEAEFMSMMGSKVVLKTPQGKTIKVPAAGLSDADKKYLSENIPPKIKIEVDVDKDRETLSSYSSEYGTYGYERKARKRLAAT